jgi:hypothetical protein
MRLKANNLNGGCEVERFINRVIERLVRMRCSRALRNTSALQTFRAPAVSAAFLFVPLFSANYVATDNGPVFMKLIERVRKRSDHSNLGDYR